MSELDKASQNAQKLDDKLKSLNDVMSRNNERAKVLIDSYESLNKGLLRGGNNFDKYISIVENGSKVMTGLTRDVVELGKKVPIIGGLFSGLDGLNNILEATTTASLNVVKGVSLVAKGMDAATSFTRNLESSLYGVVAGFGKSFEEGKGFTDFLTGNLTQLATEDFGFVTLEERLGVFEQLGDASIPLSVLEGSIDSTAGSMDVLNTVILQSQALGLDTSRYIDLLSNTVLRQGLSAQEGAEQMAMYGDISDKTGLRVNVVAGSLQKMSDGFSKMGLTADFGRPILEGFVSTLDSMGLGIGNATDLTETLSGSLAKLTSNYAAAYLTFQKGGLEFQGGALGAGIELRAKLLEAEGGEQGAVGLELAGALRDTLESFGGGEIVTVQEARMDPALQQTFFTQTSLLSQLYGIQDPGAQDRVLDLLDKIEDATIRGDENALAELGQQLEEAKEGRNQTLSLEDKLTTSFDAMLAEQQTSNETFEKLIEDIRDYNSTIIDVVQNPTKAIEDFMAEYAGGFEGISAKLDGGGDDDIDSMESWGQFGSAVRDQFSEIKDMFVGLFPEDLASDITSALQNTPGDQAVVTSIEGMRQDFQEFNRRLLDLEQTRKGKKILVEQ